MQDKSQKAGLAHVPDEQTRRRLLVFLLDGDDGGARLARLAAEQTIER